MNEKFDAFVGSFIDNRIGLCNSFLGVELLRNLRANLEQLDRDNKMRPAGIGRGTVKDPGQKIRGDRIYWIDNKSKDAHELAFIEVVENFIDYLNKTCYTGINAYEFHYALYDTGSFYLRHRDQFKNNNDRKYSLINYLNEDWLETDGGALTVYMGETPQHVLPLMPQAVFFQSCELEHEVKIANRPRMSITGWLKRM